MKKFITSLILSLVFSLTLQAQNQLENFLKEGIAYHDQGLYDQAIASYQKMLELDPHSSLGHYEISLSYMYKGDYDLAIQHSDQVIEAGGRLLVPAIVVKASSMSNLNQVDDAIALLEDAVEQWNADVMVYYNLAICYWKQSNFEKAEAALIAGIYENPMHASSHYMLATLQADRGNRTEAMLAGYFFLLLEPNTARTVKMEQLVRNFYTAGVTLAEESSKKKKNINIALPASRMESNFSTVELGLSLMAANTYAEKKGKNTDVFCRNTTTFFGLVSEVPKPKEEVAGDFTMNFYVPFFSELYETKQTDVFCNYIGQTKPGGNRRWLDKNKEKVKDFEQWVVAKSRKLIGIKEE